MKNGFVTGNNVVINCDFPVFLFLQISSYVGDNNQFYSPEDSISLSLEYYQAQLDTTAVNSTTKVKNSDNKDGESEAKKDVDVSGAGDSDEHLLKNDRRYLQCPAAVTMSHLQKFVRMKFGLTSEHKVSVQFISIGLSRFSPKRLA